MKYVFTIIFCLIVIANANAEETWEYKGSPTGKINGIVVRNDTIFCGTVNGIYYLPPNQTNWISFNEGIDKTIAITSLKMNEKKEIFAGTYGEGLFILNSLSDGWISYMDGDFSQYKFIESISIRANIVFITATQNDPHSYTWKIFLSSNYGRNWSLFEPKNKEGYPVTLFVVNKIYIDDNGALFWNSDFQDKGTWVEIMNSADCVNYNTYKLDKKILCFNRIGQILLVGTAFNKLYGTVDGGKTWNTGYSIGLNASTINDIGKFYDSGTSVLKGIVGTENGIFITTNNAETWKSMNNGLDDNSKIVYCIEFNDSGFAYIGTSAGVYIFSKSFITDVEEDTNKSIIDFNLSPNPSTDNILITISYSEYSNICIALSNSLGTEIKRFDKSELLGKSSISFSTEELPSGVYYCTMNNGTNTITKSFVVVK